MKSHEKWSLHEESFGNLYSFVRNSGINSFDLKGLKMVEVPVYLRQMGAPLTFWGIQYHRYLEAYGRSTGFAPAGNPFWFNKGLISVPDQWGGDEATRWHKESFRVAQVMINDCCIDIDKFKKEINSILDVFSPGGGGDPNILTYMTGIYDCQNYPATVIDAAVEKAKKDDAPWYRFCDLGSQWQWIRPFE